MTHWTEIQINGLLDTNFFWFVSINKFRNHEQSDLYEEYATAVADLHMASWHMAPWADGACVRSLREREEEREGGIEKETERRRDRDTERETPSSIR